MTPTMITDISPDDIENRSFSIIGREFRQQTGIDPGAVDPSRFAIIRRVIHATGDFSYGTSLQFHDQAIDAGLRALRQGKNIFFDVTMGASGVNRKGLSRFGGQVICRIGDHEVARLAERESVTRAEAALMSSCEENLGIIVVGNAPTALLAAIRMQDSGKLQADLIVGVPVGFVNAVESKELLLSKAYPHITNLGRKGGSPAGVAIVNALLQLASE